MSEISKKRKSSPADEPSDSRPKRTKKAASDALPSGTDESGNPYWELSGKRRIGISEFKGSCLISIREYYEKDGKMLPGKKGISLSLPQYEAFMKAMPVFNAKLKEMGHDVDGATAEDGTETAPAPAAAKTKKKVTREKSNIDSTSEEDDG